jgi:hypothetical protein
MINVDCVGEVTTATLGYRHSCTSFSASKMKILDMAILRLVASSSRSVGFLHCVYVHQRDTRFKTSCASQH